MKREGTVSKVTLKNKKGAAYEYWQCRYYDNTGKQKRKLFPPTQEGQREAKRFQASMSKQKSDGELVSTTQTVASWLDEYVTTYKGAGNLRPRSLQRLIQTFSLIEAGPLASVPLDKLNGAAVQKFYNQLAAGGWKDREGKEHKKLSSSTIGKVHKLLVAAYKRAKQLNMIGRNPMDAVDGVKVTYKKMSVFTAEEIGRIFQALKDIETNKYNCTQRYDYTLLFLMLLETGCRVSELLALRWEDVDLKKREIFIHTSKARDGQSFSDPKTSAGRRSIPIISNDLLAKLKAYRNRDGITRMAGYLFETQNAGAICYNRVHLMWKHVCSLAAIEGKTIHCFRHTFATQLLEKGIPTAEVSRILGHADSAITYRMYVHSIPNYNQTIIKQLKGKSLAGDTSKKTRQQRKQGKQQGKQNSEMRQPQALF